jgi:ABC-type cobalamin/Fe3+-siderophores transport system ATPase subunit
MVCLTVALASRFLKAADKIIVMSDGQIQKVGTPEEVFVEEDLLESSEERRKGRKESERDVRSEHVPEKRLVEGESMIRQTLNG